MTTLATANFNDALPAAPAGRRNAKWQADAASASPRNISLHVPNLGGVNSQAGSTYTLQASDQGKLVVLTSAASVAVTLDSTLPTDFLCCVIFLGAAGGTIAPSSGTVNGVASLPFAQNASALLFFNGTNWWAVEGASASSSGGLNGVNVQAGNYNLASGDNEKLVVHNSPSPHTFTLLNPPPSGIWAAFFQNIGAGALTISRNTLTIDGAASDLTLLQNQGAVIFTDGTNYFTERGMSGFANGVLGIVIDGGGAVPSTGSKGFLQAPYDCTIVSWTLLGNLSGGAQITVKKSTYSGFPSTSSIVAAAPPLLSSAQKNTSSSLGTWTTSISKGDVLEFNLDSVSGITRLTLELQVMRSD